MADVTKLNIGGTDYDIVDASVPSWAKASTKPTYTASEISGLANVATSGSYNDLTNKPDIPDIDDAKPLVVTIASRASGNTTYSIANVTFNQMVAAYNAGKDLICDYNGFIHRLSYSEAPDSFYFTSFQGDEGSYTCFEIHGDNDISKYSGAVVPRTRTVNGKALSSNITLSASDIGAIPTVISTTYNDLVTVRTNSQLIEGAWYRITDYTCTTSQTDTKSAGHQFDILVQAISPNRLSEEAKAIRHEGDTYFANSNLEAWKIWYCLDNDNARFSWAEPAEGKGVIYRMIDEWGNDCPYDFKNIQFKRYQLKNQNYLYASKALWDNDGGDYNNKTIINFHNTFAILYNNLGTSINSNTIPFYYTRGILNEYYIVDESEIYGYDEIYKTYRDNSGNTIALSESGTRKFVVVYNSLYDYYDIILEVNDTDGEWMYTFSRKNGINTPSIDNSLTGKIYNNKFTNSGTLYDNVFISYNIDLIVQNNTFGNDVNRNTFGNYCTLNTFGIDCKLNTFGNNFQFNSFGNSAYGNTFGNNFQTNTFGNDCDSNTFGNNCYNNSFGDGCYNNSFENNVNRNTFGNYCSSNTFGINFQTNTFGNNFQTNTFVNYCYNNSFGDGCYNNSFGNYFQFNSFGNYCSSNTFGIDCKLNTFGNAVDHVTFSKDYTCYVIVENGNRYITLTSTQTTSSSNQLRNITIAQGVNNTNTAKTISHNTLNDTFRTIYTTDVNGNIYAIAPTKYSEWDNKQSTLVSGTNIKTINNQSLLGSGNLTASDIDADAFIVNITYSNGTYISDKTYSQITTAYNSKRNIFAVYYGAVYQLIQINNYGIRFVNFSQMDVEDRMDVIYISASDSISYDEIYYQRGLISGTNIKTINNQSLLGSGNIEIESGGNVTVENVTDTGDVIKSLEPNIFYKFGTVNSLTIPLISGTDLAVYSGKFTIDSLSTALSFFVVPATVTTAYSCPTITAGNTYEFNILDNVLMMLEI